MNVISDHFRFFVRSIVCPNGVSLKSFLQRKKDASKFGDGGDSPIKGETGLGLEPVLGFKGLGQFLDSKLICPRLNA